MATFEVHTVSLQVDNGDCYKHDYSYPMKAPQYEVGLYESWQAGYRKERDIIGHPEAYDKSTVPKDPMKKPKKSGVDYKDVNTVKGSYANGYHQEAPNYGVDLPALHKLALSGVYQPSLTIPQKYVGNIAYRNANGYNGYDRLKFFPEYKNMHNF